MSPTEARSGTGLATVLVVAALLRLPALESVPPPLNQDEASRGYDAWCLLETGADRHGRPWPLFLESFGPGDFTASLSTCLTIPFVALIGPTATAMRLPDALLGVATVALVHSWLLRTLGNGTALIGAAILAADPWHISLCRTAHEAGFAPFFLAMALDAASRAGWPPAAPDRRQATRSRLWAFVAVAMLGLHAWVYPATRLFTPLICIAAALIERRRIRAMLGSASERGLASAAILGATVGSTPLWLTALSNPHQLAARAQFVTLRFIGHEWRDSLIAVLGNYAANVSPTYLFLNGNGLANVPLPKVGMHLLIAAPLILAGLLTVIHRAQRETWPRLVLAWVLLAPLPAAICGDWNPHPLRTVSAMLLGPLLAGIGGAQAIIWLKSTARPLRMAVCLAAILAFVANVAWFANQFFRVYPAEAQRGFQTPLVRAIEFAAGHADESDFILVTNRANQPYIYALLYGRIPPKQLAAAPPIIAPGPLDFHQVIRVGKFFFMPRDPTNHSNAGRLFENEWKTLRPGARGLVIEDTGVFREGELVATFEPAIMNDPRDAYEVRRWEKRR